MIAPISIPLLVRVKGLPGKFGGERRHVHELGHLPTPVNKFVAQTRHPRLIMLMVGRWPGRKTPACPEAFQLPKPLVRGSGRGGRYPATVAPMESALSKSGPLRLWSMMRGFQEMLYDIRHFTILEMQSLAFTLMPHGLAGRQASSILPPASIRVRLTARDILSSMSRISSAASLISSRSRLPVQTKWDHGMQQPS